MELQSPVGTLKGVGKKTEQLFQKTGIFTVGELLQVFPREYARFPQPVSIKYVVDDPENKQAIFFRVERPVVVKRTRNMPITIVNGMEDGKELEILWFRMPYIRNTLKLGQAFIFYGKVRQKGRQLSMEQPAIYTSEQYEALADSLQPIYGLTAGLSNNLYKKALKQALSQNLLFPEYLPKELRQKYVLAEYNYAIAQMHFPDSKEALIEARKRLVFDEFFLFILSVQRQKEQTKAIENVYQFVDEDQLLPLLKKLPYQLTNAQLRTLEEIRQDLHGDYIMQRLVQGDVGSGKTIIAFLAMYLVSKSGYQSAIMAPTEVLATQHYETFQEYCSLLGLDIPLILLTGALTAKQKRDAYERMQLYENAMIIGTHALIQEKAVYEDLALVVTDEQHRFGVKQREVFSLKGHSPHILVMSATPIPRTLAIILYGDLDISVIDEVPAKRLPIKNCVVGKPYRPKAYEFIAKQVEQGHQAYVICPFVEASEYSEGENVIDYSSVLMEQLPSGISVGILHGKMRPADKNQIMEQFAKNQIQVLVSTTVVEVGVNVPNATVMMIEDAQRFGLAQLHQLRGRVGRGDAQSYCIFLNTSEAKDSGKRLQILNQSNDGFKIASEDLKLRGPGDFFGIRQSGDLVFQLADIYQDASVMKMASEEATKLLATDPKLELPEHAALKQRLEAYQSESERLNL